MRDGWSVNCYKHNGADIYTFDKDKMIVNLQGNCLYFLDNKPMRIKVIGFYDFETKNAYTRTVRIKPNENGEMFDKHPANLVQIASAFLPNGFFNED